MKLKEFTKSTAEVYKLKFDNSAFANITLEEISECAGSISISYDWGNFAYSWGAMGMPLKQFLVKCDEYYLGRCFGVRDVIDEDATKKGFYNLIKELRTERAITADEAKEICDDIKRNISFDNVNSVAAFDCKSYRALKAKNKHFTPHEFIEMETDPSFGIFYKNVWSEFVKILKEELI